MKRLGREVEGVMLHPDPTVAGLLALGWLIFIVVVIGTLIWDKIRLSRKKWPDDYLPRR
jgi:hypothetical protein